MTMKLSNHSFVEPSLELCSTLPSGSEDHFHYTRMTLIQRMLRMCIPSATDCHPTKNLCSTESVTY